MKFHCSLYVIYAIVFALRVSLLLVQDCCTDINLASKSCKLNLLNINRNCSDCTDVFHNNLENETPRVLSAICQVPYPSILIVIKNQDHHLHLDPYSCVTEIILSCSITAWHRKCFISERKALQHMAQTAQFITEQYFPVSEDICAERCIRMSCILRKDASHSSQELFAHLP